MIISVCIGSSCHLKGSYDVVNSLKALIEKNKLHNDIKLTASFCLGKCKDGVTIKIDDDYITGINSDNIEDIFINKIMSRL